MEDISVLFRPMELRGGISSFRSIKASVRSWKQPGDIGLFPKYFENNPE